MRIAIIMNPKSGRNRAKALAQACFERFDQRGHSPVLIPVSDPGLDQELASAERLVVVGGDGTVHHSIPKLLEHQLPFVHVPTGTANLIAHEFGMSRDPRRVVDWVERAEPTRLNVPTLDGAPFLIMLNAGADAGVIHRFEHARKGSGGYKNYIRPVTGEVFRPRPAHLWVRVDGDDRVALAPGNLTIANMRSSALKINPCHRADPSDGRLDMLANTCSTTLGWTLATWMLRARLSPLGSVRAQGARFEIGAVEDCVFQFDGEIARTHKMPNGILSKGGSVIVEVGHQDLLVLRLPQGR